jgi:hypothetical protein
VVSGRAHVRLALSGFGYASAVRRVGRVAPRADGNRVEYAHAGVREWYANGPLGLEQGFDVPGRPAAGSGPLTFSLRLSGSVHARLDRRGVSLVGRGSALRYGGLTVTDARGRTLRSWLGLRSGRVVISVDDRRAAYPLRVDPFLQQAKLTPSDGSASDNFGGSVAVSGNTIVAGAPSRAVGSNAGQGAVYVFVMPSSGWANGHQTAELTASDGAAGDDLGDSVAVSGNTIVAGAPSRQVLSNAAQGAAYVFVMPASGWANTNETAELTAADGIAGDRLGTAVAMSGNAIVAAPDPQQEAAVYAFVAPPPAITLSSPANGAQYTQGQAIAAAYSCAAPAGGTITACSGPVSSGAPVDTTTLGSHSFTVNAGDNDGITATQTATYTVVPVAAIPPSVTALSESASVWREGSKLAQFTAKKKPPVGTTFSFTLNEQANLTLTFTQRLSGRRVHGKCVAQTKKNKVKPRCKRAVTAGTLTLAADQGSNKIRFYGRLSPTKRLKPSSYAVTIAATNAAQQRSTSRPLKFKIVK